MRLIKQKLVHWNFITMNKFVQFYIGSPGGLSVFKVFYVDLKVNKNEPLYDSKNFSKILHRERGWEEPLVKIAKILMYVVAFFVYFDEKFDDNNNFFQRNTGNQKFSKRSAKLGDICNILAKQEIRTLSQEFP